MSPFLTERNGDIPEEKITFGPLSNVSALKLK